MNVASILKIKSDRVVTVSQDVTLHAAAKALADNNIGAVVVTGEDTSVVGIISERDIVRLIARDGHPCLDGSVASAMTKDVVTCTRADTIEAVMERMTAGRFRHVPVVEDGQLVGIISIGDVVKSHIAEVELEASALRTYLVSG